MSAPELLPSSLASMCILVVEDEPFIAFDIADAIESAGATTVGPAGTVKTALELLKSDRIDAAILDVNLHDGDVAPVIEALSARGLPFIIHTGAGLTSELKQKHPELAVYYKPTAPEVLVAVIGSKLARA